MDLITGNVCAICAEEFCSSESIAIGTDVPKLLKFLFTKINCSSLQNIQLCTSCLEKVQDARNFKMLYVEKKTLNVAIKMEQTDSEVYICRVCKEIIKKSSSASFTKDVKLILNYLNDGMPMGVEATEDSHMCISCQESVMNFHSVVKLLSNFVENIEQKGNEIIHIELPNDPSKIDIKVEPLMEHSNIADEHSMIKPELVEIENIKHDIKTELTHENDASLTFEDFIMKNEEADIKTECEESVSAEHSNEQMWKFQDADIKIIPFNLTSQDFTVDHENKKVSRDLNIYSTSDIPKFTCDICGHKTQLKGNLKNHMLIHKNINEIKIFACDICAYTTKLKGNLRTHMLQHKNVDEIEMFACDVCDYKAKLKGNLIRHVLKHKNVDDITMFSCDLCEYKTKRKSDLKRHLLVHKNINEIKIFPCVICGYKAKRKSDLKNHMLQHQNVDEIEMFMCNICGYKTRYKSAFNNHTLQHKSVDEIKMFTCDICDHATKYKSHLKIHMLLHKNIDEIKMFNCDICEYKTKRKSYIKTHMLQHKNVNEIEMFACDICNHKTRHKRNLKVHMLQHKNADEIKMFACDICDYKTKHKSHLTTHQQIHKSIDEIKMFKCDICEYKAKRNAHLRRHIKLIHTKV